MKREEISEAVGNIDDTYIREAANYSVPEARAKKKIRQRWLVAAACALVMICGVAGAAIRKSAVTGSDKTAHKPSFRKEAYTAESMNFKLYELETFDSIGNVLGVSEYENTIYMLDETYDNGLCRLSSADGVTWNEEDIQTDFSSDGANVSLTCADVDEDGQVVVAYEVIDDDGTVKSGNVWSSGSNQSVEMESAEIKRLVCHNGKWYVYDGSSIAVYDENYADENFDIDVTDMVDFCVSESEVTVLDDNGITIYDAETGEKKTNDTTFAETYRDDIERTKDSFGYDTLSCRQVMKYAGDDKLCIALEDNVYVYDVEGRQVKCLFDADGNEYKTAVDTLYGYSVVENGDGVQKIIAVCSMGNEKKAVMLTAGEVDTGTTEEETDEITVYSLYYAECVEMMIDTFSSNNGGVSVKYTWGIDDNSGVSVSDAVSALNTELLAGKGPDVIVMDGLNIRNYEKAGVLLELSDVKAGILEDEPECLTEVMDAYKTDDELYAIPSKVQFTAVVGVADEVSAINDMTSLISYIESADKPNYGNDLNIYEWEELFDIVYPLYASEIIDANGNYDGDALLKFVEEFKSLYDLEMSRATKDEIAAWINENVRCTTPLYNRDYSGQSIALMSLNSVSQAWEFYSIKHDVKVGGSVENTANEDYIYHIWENGGEASYIPTLVFSINAGCENEEAAKAFVSYMFSTDIQKQYYSDSAHLRQGNPVNVKAIKGLNEDMLRLGTPGGVENVGGEQYLFSSYFTSDEDMDEYIGALKTLKSPTFIDAEVEEIIREQMEGCIDGETSADETYSAMDNLLGIYLSE